MIIQMCRPVLKISEAGWHTHKLCIFLTGKEERTQAVLEGTCHPLSMFGPLILNY